MSTTTSTSTKGNVVATLPAPTAEQLAMGGGTRRKFATKTGDSVCSILRTLGHRYPDLTPKGAAAYLEAQGIKGVSMATVKTQLYQGRSGNVGKSEAKIG